MSLTTLRQLRRVSGSGEGGSVLMVHCVVGVGRTGEAMQGTENAERGRGKTGVLAGSSAGVLLLPS